MTALADLAVTLAPLCPILHLVARVILQKKKKKKEVRVFLVAPWIRIHLPMWETQSRKIPHAAEQLNLCTTTTEPAV